MKLRFLAILLSLIGFLVLSSILIWKYTNGLSGLMRVSLTHSIGNQNATKLIQTKISSKNVNYFAREIGLKVDQLNVEIVDVPQKDLQYAWDTDIASSIGFEKKGNIQTIKIFFDTKFLDKTQDLPSLLSYQLARAMVKLQNTQLNSAETTAKSVSYLKRLNLNGKLIY